jgi:hypothetical protein
MFKVPLSRVALIVCLSVALSTSAFAQIYTPPPSAPPPSSGGTSSPAPPSSSPTPTPSPAPPSSGTGGTTTAAPPPATTTTGGSTTTTTSTTPTTTGATATSTSGLPGYTPSGNYSTGRTVAYIIVPFAAVAGTYLIKHRQIEIHPNAGFFWPRHVDKAHLRDEGMYGVKASTAFNDYVHVEGNFGYINHFESRFAPTALDQTYGITPRTIHGLVYDINGLFDFGRRPMFGGKLSPYVTAGIGGLSTEVRRDDVAVVGGQFYTTDATTGNVFLDTSRKMIVTDNKAFFAINYGGGFKATNLKGPMGFRVDFRGRTFPNFFGRGMTWPEATAGLTFTIGER